MQSLVLDAGLLHVAAPFSLARDALETFACAAWILTGHTREDRLLRVLRWHATNVVDGNRAMKDLPVNSGRPVQEQWRLVDEVAGRISAGQSYRASYTSTESVKAAEAAFPRLRFGVLFPWQLCSGFAHARPWAVQGGSEQRRAQEPDSDMVTTKITSTLETVLYPAVAADDLVEGLVRLYDDRASAP